MTKQEMIETVNDHIDFDAPITVVRNGENDYSVYAECSDDYVEINISKSSI